MFSDGTFPNAGWTVTTETLNLGGTGSGAQFASGGNPGEYRRTTNTLNSALGQGFSNTVWTIHMLTGATYDPGTSGPITSIDYSEASMRASGGVQACGLAIRQGSVVYLASGFLNPTTFNVWATTTQTGLSATQFDATAAGLQTPNFSAAGGPIQFGFYRANSTSVGGGGGTTVGGIDNWTVTVNYETPIAARQSTWGKVKALYRD